MQKFSLLALGVVAPFLGCVALSSLEASTSQESAAVERLGADEATADEAIRALVAEGEDAIPLLREALSHPDPLVRARAKEALGKITGQWGGGKGLVWKRSLKEAAGGEKPLMVLHLFGRFDEEFC